VRPLAPSFAREWVCVGRVEDVAEPGAWLRAPVTPAGVILVRGAGAELRAFHAVCTHRGSALGEEEEGSGAIACPYHGARFGPDGAPECGPAEKPLAPVRVAEAHGFVFATLSDSAPPLEDALGEIPPWLERASLGRLKRARRVAYDVAARWTLVVENFQESLHFADVHPALEAITPSEKASTWMPEAGADGPWLGGIMPIEGDAETVSVSKKRGERPFIVPPEDRRVVHDAMRFPNLLTSLQPDYLLTFTLFPIAEDRTRVIASTYVDRDAPESSWGDVFAFWSRVYEEDRIACERQERGVASLPIAPAYTNVEEGAQAFARMAAERGAPAKHCGIFGRPYVDLSEVLDTSCFPELDREIALGLARVETGYTGGSLKWMGVCAPWVMRDGYRDYMHLLRDLPREELADFLALGDLDPADFDLDDRDELAFGDETDHPLCLAQMKWLKMRHAAYFPWKVCYHLLENDRWDDKHSGEGKDFSEEAREHFPKTVAFVESLPFSEIGRVVLFGVEAHDHAPAHRDSEPGKALAIAQSISFAPGARQKRFYVTAPDGTNQVVIDAPIYWFNDMDWHGVLPDPYFRYSIRVDGVLEAAFVDMLRRRKI
jgi:Rieske 2Fe-2S family protein